MSDPLLQAWPVKVVEHLGGCHCHPELLMRVGHQPGCPVNAVIEVDEALVELGYTVVGNGMLAQLDKFFGFDDAS